MHAVAAESLADLVLAVLRYAGVVVQHEEKYPAAPDRANYGLGEVSLAVARRVPTIATDGDERTLASPLT